MDEHTATEIAYKNGYEQGKKDAVKWIPVTERLPNGRGAYLCIYVYGERDMLFYDILMFHPEQNAKNGYVTRPHFSNEGVQNMRVTHWMPLPAPPKDGE